MCDYALYICTLQNLMYLFCFRLEQDFYNWVDITQEFFEAITGEFMILESLLFMYLSHTWIVLVLMFTVQSLFGCHMNVQSTLLWNCAKVRSIFKECHFDLLFMHLALCLHF